MHRFQIEQSDHSETQCLRSFDTPAEDPLVGSIAQQLLKDRESHDKTAQEWTKRFAQG